MRMAQQTQESLLNFIEDVRSSMTADQQAHYNFLKEKLGQFRKFRKESAAKERIDHVIEIYKTEIRIFEQGVNGNVRP